MLRAFADFLRKQTRMGDVLCRYGGDEFMVILKHLHDADTAIKRGIDICGKFNEDYAKEQPYASCSGGIALCEVNEKLSESLIERADQALYRAKRENKGSCCLWEE